jgi:outer membrane protein OmpA-like peptidoglycan-associated protein
MKQLFTLFFFNAILFGYGFAQQDFGSVDFGLVNMKGSIYFISDTTQSMPENIEKQKPEGYIYCTKLDIPVRNFTEGFPGVTDRYEYFGIVYKGIFEINEPGTYLWRLSSDDGSMLWIDNDTIINNDFVHGAQSVTGEIDLKTVLHSIKVWFFQGPATEIALQLFVMKPGSEEENIFDLSQYNQKLMAATKSLKATVTDEGIKIQLPDKLLFDPGKSVLKSDAYSALNALADILRTYPQSKVRIDGHTDNTGIDADNIKLSEDRAVSVLNELQKRDLPNTIKFETKGFGSSKPVASNASEDGRSQNRRVDVLIIP